MVRRSTSGQTPRVSFREGKTSWRELLTRQRWIEVARITLVGFVILLHSLDVLPVRWLYGAVAVGLYPLVKTGLVEVWRRRQLGTEIFVTLATLVALIGGEEVAGAVLM